MNKHIYNENRVEKIFEENPLLQILKHKIIIKKNEESLQFNLNQIRNLRVLKKRNLIPNFTVLTLSGILLIVTLKTKNHQIASEYIRILLVFILFIFSYILKSYKYSLLLNTNSFGFYEITLSKKNIKYAKKFLNDFKQNKIAQGDREKQEDFIMKKCY
ncbi:hypothetical protein [Flavobacterium sp. DSR3-2]|uniref:hypothetical protein n=1 Tax=Flavobacterium sp. DSR3-2 TaxID=2804634 RepID=UPI003CF504B9